MRAYRNRHHHYPVVAFLDIKAAYDTVDRRIIWQSMLASSAPKALVSLLANLFDDVMVSVLLNNVASDPFFPSTGVLQGSVLSPHLYSPQQLVSLRHLPVVLLVPVMAPMVWFLVFHLVQPLLLLTRLRLPPPSTVSSTLMMWLSLGLLAKFGICWT
ncbi:hypothetical protein G6F56_013884 [Rhizopus delemar]|nr:hypothetical protein G6F56_013884 [Rhizopus delemar]